MMNSRLIKECRDRLKTLEDVLASYKIYDESTLIREIVTIKKFMKELNSISYPA